MTNPSVGRAYAHLGPAEQAHEIWCAIMDDRLNAGNPGYQSLMHYDRITATVERTEGTVLGALLLGVIGDAQSRELPEDLATVSRRVLAELWAEARRLDPPPVPKRDASTTCRHGVSFADPCEECGP